MSVGAFDYVLQNQIPTVQGLPISAAQIVADHGLATREIDELEETFKSFIHSNLDEAEPEDYDLVWQMEKYLFDKNQRLHASQRT